MALWASLWKLFIYIEFGSLFIIVSLFAAVFGNLGQKEAGDLSGYSVFNKGFKTLLGQSTGQQFDNEIRHKFNDENDDDGFPPHGEPKIKLQKDVVRRTGKKARRTYEARLERRKLENERLETFDEYLN